MFHRVAVAMFVLVCLAPCSLFAVTPEMMRADLNTRYKITSLDTLGFLKETGTVLVVRKEGLRVDRPGAFNRPTVIRDGQVAETGGASLPLGGNNDGALKVGDMLHIYGILVNDTTVELNLATVKGYVLPGTRGAVKLQAIVRFRYDQGLAAVTGREVLRDIEAWLGTENAMRVSKTVNQGQTFEEVTAVLGEPEKKVLLGSKTVFIYSDMKLVFRDGRLVDME